MKGYARAFKINIVNDRDLLVQLQETRQEICRFLKRLKVEMGVFKYSEALEVDPIMEVHLFMGGAVVIFVIMEIHIDLLGPFEAPFTRQKIFGAARVKKVRVPKKLVRHG